MKYTSTRDGSKFYSFAQALFSGYAPDGGLFVPEQLPTFWDSPESKKFLLKKWSELGYVDLATELLDPFLGGGISKTELHTLLSKALDGFDVSDKNKVPVVPLSSTSTTSTTNSTTTTSNIHTVDCYVAELFHGPTYCFKDLGMRVTIFLMNYFGQNTTPTTTSTASAAAASGCPNPRTIVLTAATTGDTGPAAVQAVQDLDSPHMGIVVHYPQGQISDFQRKQMTTICSDRVRVVAFEGGGDDMDRPIKNIMMNPKENETNNSNNSNNNDSKQQLYVCGVNSYNIGRPLMQMVHFVWTYLRVVEHIERTTQTIIDHEIFRLDIVIPTGAMGNIAGCYMAKKFGMPFGNICAGVNTNDITHRAFSTGMIQKPKSGEPMKASLSDAINIQLPYNLERLLFYLTDQNHALIKAWYDRLESKNNDSEKYQDKAGTIDLTTTTTTCGRNDEKDSSSHSASSTTSTSTTTWLDKLQSEFRSARVTDEVLCTTIQDVLKTYSYWIDPHTGVAFGAAQQLGYFSSSSSSESDAAAAAAANPNPVAIMATASPCKFELAMKQAVGSDHWKEYEDQHFPARAKDLKDKEELPPNRYRADSNKTLEENQIEWEASTRALIAQVGGNGGY